MTVEKRTLIDVGDVLGIEYDCDCGSTQAVTVEGFRKAIVRCPNCEQVLISDAPGRGLESEQVVLNAFIKALRDTRTLTPRIKLHIVEQSQTREAEGG